LKTLTPRWPRISTSLLIGWLLLSPAGFVGATIQQTAVKSTLGSTDGNVLLLAGENYRQVGSDVIAVKGDALKEALLGGHRHRRQDRRHR
jgi:hypothetical protein